MKILPVVFRWREVDVTDPETGLVERAKAMVPLARYGNLAARQYRDGEEYPMAPLEVRSRASHSHYFAALADGFQSLPEGDRLKAVAHELNLITPPGGFIDAEHFRKWALCQTGSCSTVEVNCESPEEARKLARFYRSENEYAHIVVRGSHAIVKTAKSQSHASMAKEEFEESKRSVLDLLAAMLNVSRTELERNAGKSA